MIGEQIGNFRIVARIGRGGMGEVYLAEQQSIETKVAIKMLRPEISEDTDHVKRFFNEARAVSKIRHAGIVKIFDVGFHHGRAYLVMELLEGQTLGARLRANHRLPTKDVADIGRQIASVLAATHAAGVTHRDLKPDNIFIVPDHEMERGERVKVLDFGVAKLSGTLAASSPRTQGTLGTPAYMAPEQWDDSAKVDWRADAYSLGCIAFEMTCGQPPFKVTSYAAACHKHMHEPPPPVRSLIATAPEALDALVAQLLAKQPADRPASMAEIGRVFAAIGDAASDDTLPPAPPAVIDPAADGHAATVSSARPEAKISTDAETLDDTTMGGAAAQVERAPAPAPGGPATAPRRRGAVIAAAIAGAAVAAAGVYAVTRPGRSSSREAVVPAPPAIPDARPIVVADVPAPDAPAPDAPVVIAATTVDARPRSSPPDAPVWDDFPDELDQRYIDKVNAGLRRKLARCGEWTDTEGYGATFHIGMDGQVSELELTGPDPNIKACMMRIVLAARYGFAKHGLDYQLRITH